MLELLRVAAVSMAVCASAAQPPRVTPGKLPAFFPAAGVVTVSDARFKAHDYDEAQFQVAKPKGDGYDEKTVRGRYWTARLEPLPSEGDAGWDGFAKWKALETRLSKEGFRRVWYDEKAQGYGAYRTATFERGGEHPVFIDLEIGRKRDEHDATVEIVEAADNPDSVVLPAPGPAPDRYDGAKPPPYLKPLPDMKFSRMDHGDTGLDWADPKGAMERHGTGTVFAYYGVDQDKLSNVGFADAYVRAFKKAGWSLGQTNDEQGYFYARYAKNGRDIWLYGRMGEDAQFQIADVGAELAATLAKDCKAAVYGVNFDFNKATLRPEAEPALTQVLRVLKQQAGLKVEIGGHTDDVGDKAYNQRLSARRAEAVKAWLVSRGIAASRLTTHGYGDSVPLVPNDSDEHRFQNRRVELKKPDCGS